MCRRCALYCGGGVDVTGSGAEPADRFGSSAANHPGPGRAVSDKVVRAKLRSRVRRSIVDSTRTPKVRQVSLRMPRLASGLLDNWSAVYVMNKHVGGAQLMGSGHHLRCGPALRRMGIELGAQTHMAYFVWPGKYPCRICQDGFLAMPRKNSTVRLVRRGRWWMCAARAACVCVEARGCNSAAFHGVCEGAGRSPLPTPWGCVHPMCCGGIRPPCASPPHHGLRPPHGLRMGSGHPKPRCGLQPPNGLRPPHALRRVAVAPCVAAASGGTKVRDACEYPCLCFWFQSKCRLIKLMPMRGHCGMAMSGCRCLRFDGRNAHDAFRYMVGGALMCGGNFRLPLSPAPRAPACGPDRHRMHAAGHAAI